ncbi:MAG: leucine-rich repeat protein [Prevotella sp.]|nr:leucine-rich repeat protein [Prevotella sp.]
MTSIGNYAFAKCYRLISITIPSGVTNIGDYAFWFCSNLQNIYCYAEQVTEIGNNVFENSNYDATLHVPAASISAYQAAESWKNFKEIVALPDQASQDEYRPFVEEGKVWKVGHVQTILDNSVNVVDYYYFDGDTIIDGKTCKQMMCQRYVSPDYSNEYGTPTPSLTKVGAWYEEDKKVYFYNEWQQSMKLKYDFSLAANDTLKFLTDGSSPFIIGPKQTGGIEGFKGVYRDIRMCGDEGQSYHDTFWLEGVGCLRGPIRNPCDPIFGDPVPEFLMSCTVGDEVIYLNDDYEDGATPEGMGARKKRFDFTHTIKIQPKSRIRKGEEQSLYGEYNDQQLGIHLDPLDDDYLVSITDETDKNVYQKAIYAGSIVALNIDISNFTKGHYTVTVENSSEYFTGEFNAQTTGIDVDGDGILTAKDITAIVNSIASKTIDESIKSAADVNGDKMVNIADIVRIANKIMVTDSLTTNP